MGSGQIGHEEVNQLGEGELDGQDGCMTVAHDSLDTTTNVFNTKHAIDLVLSPSNPKTGHPRSYLHPQLTAF